MDKYVSGRRAITIPAFLVTAILMIAGVPGALAGPDYVWGEASAAKAIEPQYEGYWKYCLSFGWDFSDYPGGAHGASHVSLALELEECIADCGEACFVFADTVGTGVGVEGCGIRFYAEFDLWGDPTVPPDIPTVKFEPYPDVCEPDIAGSGTVCFYSLFAPEAADSEGASIWIKFGQYVEQGLVTGPLPSCKSTTAVGRSTWGSIKRLFK